jgi:hypothetical protein
VLAINVFPHPIRNAVLDADRAVYVIQVRKELLLLLHSFLSQQP